MATDWSDTIVVADLADEPALSDELNALIERAEGDPADDVPHVVLNCAQVTYLNSSNIAQLLRLRNRLKECGRGLRLCSVTDQVWTLILATGLDRVFQFSPDPMTALAGLQLQQTDTD
ncbi:MAG: STAS domain-containing protein [Planctomycetes bacterium]|nr:STAS domain-containing protein [Planctomycetota bacterium]